MGKINCLSKYARNKRSVGEIMDDKVKNDLMDTVERLTSEEYIQSLYYDKEHHEKQVLEGVKVMARREGIKEGENKRNIDIAKIC